MKPSQNTKKARPVEVALDMGKRAFLSGKQNSPYKTSSHLFKEWQRGYNTAYFDNLERIRGLQ
jgi:hypothetical protein